MHEWMPDLDAWSAILVAMPWLWGIYAAVLGACFASFGGVVVHRLPRMIGWDRPEPDPAENLVHGSRCEGCGTKIGPLALVPVFGWLVKRGRCGSCGCRVPAKYPLVEAATAALSFSFAYLVGFGDASALGLPVIWTCVVLAWIDWEEFLLPDCITAPLILAGLLWSPFESDPYARIEGMALCAACLWTAFFVIGRIRGEDTMSGGDLMMIAAGGAWLGIQAVPLFMGLIGVGHVALATPLRLRGQLQAPMGPALAVAFVVCLFLAAVRT